MYDLQNNKIIEQQTTKGEDFSIVLYKVENTKDNTIEYWTTYPNYGLVRFYIGIKKEDFEELDQKLTYEAYNEAYNFYYEQEILD